MKLNAKNQIQSILAPLSEILRGGCKTRGDFNMLVPNNFQGAQSMLIILDNYTTRIYL